jgi:hypothetical protein
LDDYARSDASFPAAIIVIKNDSADYYKKKWDFAPMVTNWVSIKPQNNPNSWEGFVHPGPTAAAPKARQVIYRDHTADILAGGGFTIPGDARWRWVKNDERLWVGCDAGCCEGIN